MTFLARVKALFGGRQQLSDSSGFYRQGAHQLCQPPAIGVGMTEDNFYRSVFGVADSLEEISEQQNQIASRVEMELKLKDYRGKAVPRLPSVIPRLLRSLRDPDASAVDYVKIINKDPAMSAAVLRLANSAYFNPVGKRIDGIDTAVVKLGIDGLRSVLSAAVMQPIIQRRSPYFSRFGGELWRHSLDCAVACEILAKRRGLEPYKAYLLGLSHDIGKITVFCELCRQFRSREEQVEPSFGAFSPLMKSFSAKLSGWVAKDWELPEEVIVALQEQVTIDHDSEVSAYGHLLFQANLACEVYACRRKGDTEMDPALANELSLPQDLFVTLEALAQEVEA